MEKPNLERIADLLVRKQSYDSVSEAKNELLKIYLDEWKGISEERFYYPEFPELEKLISEYNIPENLIPDFRFIGSRFLHTKGDEYSHSIMQRNCIKNYEMIQALKFIIDEKKGYKIELKSKGDLKTKSVRIENQTLIHIFEKSLFDYLKEYEDISEEETEESGLITFVNLKFEEEKRKQRKGRKRGSNTIGKLAYYLQKYLQENTEIKYKEESGYSKEQLRFIFEFLNIYGLNKKVKGNPNTEDNIAHYLNQYKKSIEENFDSVK